MAERRPSIEDTNAAGGRFIREAKIYDLKIKSFRDALEDAHPSLDASAKRARRTPGADVVSQELDQMNKEYSNLIDTVQKILAQLKDEEAKLQEKRVSFSQVLSCFLIIVKHAVVCSAMRSFFCTNIKLKTFFVENFCVDFICN